MAVLILFATIEGQTKKIARFVAERVRAAGQEAKLIEVSEDMGRFDFDGADKVVLAAPVHERRHPRAFEAEIAAHLAELSERATLFLSVGLKAAFPEGMDEAADYMTEMKLRTGFTPDQEMLVPGAIRPGSYDYFATQIMRFVVLRGQEFDPSQGEHEFTDWDALGAKVDAFLTT